MARTKIELGERGGKNASLFYLEKQSEVAMMMKGIKNIWHARQKSGLRDIHAMRIFVFLSVLFFISFSLCIVSSAYAQQGGSYNPAIARTNFPVYTLDDDGEDANAGFTTPVVQALKTTAIDTFTAARKTVVALGPTMVVIYSRASNLYGQAKAGIESAVQAGQARKIAEPPKPDVIRIEPPKVLAAQQPGSLVQPPITASATRQAIPRPAVLPQPANAALSARPVSNLSGNTMRTFVTPGLQFSNTQALKSPSSQAQLLRDMRWEMNRVSILSQASAKSLQTQMNIGVSNVNKLLPQSALSQQVGLKTLMPQQSFVKAADTRNLMPRLQIPGGTLSKVLEPLRMPAHQVELQKLLPVGTLASQRVFGLTATTQLAAFDRTFKISDTKLLAPAHLSVQSLQLRSLGQSAVTVKAASVGSLATRDNQLMKLSGLQSLQPPLMQQRQLDVQKLMPTVPLSSSEMHFSRVPLSVIASNTEGLRRLAASDMRQNLMSTRSLATYGSLRAADVRSFSMHMDNLNEEALTSLKPLTMPLAQPDAQRLATHVSFERARVAGLPMLRPLVVFDNTIKTGEVRKIASQPQKFSDKKITFTASQDLRSPSVSIKNPEPLRMEIKTPIHGVLQKGIENSPTLRAQAPIHQEAAKMPSLTPAIKNTLNLRALKPEVSIRAEAPKGPALVSVKRGIENTVTLRPEVIPADRPITPQGIDLRRPIGSGFNNQAAEVGEAIRAAREEKPRLPIAVSQRHSVPSSDIAVAISAQRQGQVSIPFGRWGYLPLFEVDERILKDGGKEVQIPLFRSLHEALNVNPEELSRAKNSINMLMDSGIAETVQMRNRVYFGGDN